MTLNKKQKNWARNKVIKAQGKLLMQFAFGIMLILGAVALAAYMIEPWFSLPELLGVGSLFGIGGYGVVSAGLMTGVGNIEDPPNTLKAGRQVKARLWILAEDQWDDTKPFPSRVGREVGDIPLKAGEKWHYIHAAYDSVKPTWTGEEGEIASQITNELPFVVGGMDDSIFNLLENGLNKGFFVVWEICATGERFIGGNGCKPMKLVSFDGASNDESTSTNIIFRNQCGHTWSKYIGNTPTQDPQVVAADATTIALVSGNNRYQLTNGTVASVVITGFTSVTDSDVNRVVTILGSGGTYPSDIEDGNDFLLIGGETWAAEAGKQISFKIFKDGAATYKFVEVAGSRI